LKQTVNPAPSPRSKQLSHTALVLLAILALTYALFAGLRTVGDMDLGWQMATGRWIVEHHKVPFTDVLSYTARGREWIYPALSQVVEYCVYLFGGYSLLSWLGAVACVGTIAILLRRGHLPTAILAVVAVPMIASRTSPRAEMFSQVLFAVFVSILWHYHRSKNGPLWLLPPLMCLWVNLHLGFVAGLGMCAAYIFLELAESLTVERRAIAIRRLRAATPWLLGTLGATLLNPWGPWNYVGMLKLFPVQSNRWIVELMRVRVTSSTLADALTWRDPRSTLFWFVAVAALAALSGVYVRNLGAALILGSSIYFAIHAARFVGLFAAIVVVIGGSLFADALEVDCVRRSLRRTSAFIGNRGRVVATWGFLTIACSFVVIRVWDLISNRYYMRTPEQFSEFGPGAFSRSLDQATDFILRERLPGNIFNDFNSGGFVTWKLSPTYPDYIDGRGGPFGIELFLRSEKLLSESLDAPEWQQEAATRNINTVIVSLDRELGGGLSGLDKFCESQGWRPVYLDAYAAVFLRARPETSDLVNRLHLDCQKVKFDQPPVTGGNRGKIQQFNYFLNAAAVLIVLDRNAEALQFVERAERISSDNAFLHYAKGMALEGLGRLTDAENQLRVAVDLDSSDAALALARDYEQEGRYKEEADILSRAAERASSPHFLYLRLAYAQLHSGHPDLALASFDKAETESPFVGDAYSLGADFRAQIAEGRRRALLESRPR
jgi:hypothetical protein